MSLSVGFGLVTAQVPPGGSRSVADEYRDVLALARLAEDLGFDGVWASEHHFAEDAYLPSVLVLLAAIAAVTRHIQLGTAVALAPFHHPLRFAEDAAVLDQLSRGRLMLGIAAGWRGAEFTAFGMPLQERVTRTTELARVCRLAWDNERFSFTGKYWSFADVAVTPRPYGLLPLLLGGSAAPAVARAGRLGQGFIGTGTPSIGVDGLRSRVALFDEAARSAGKNPEQLPIGFHVNAWVSPDGQVDAAVFEAMWNQVGRYQLWHAQDDGSSATLMPPVDEHEIRKRAFLGTPQEVVAAAQPWIEAFGHRNLHVIFRLHYPGLRAEVAADAMRLFATEVMPPLKALALRGR